MNLKITLTSPYRPEIATLIAASDAVAQALYPAESNHLVDIASLAQPNVVFCAAAQGDEVVGCGAAVVKPAGYAEIKRMFVADRARGQRVGTAILTFLETQCREQGVTTTRLETGIYSYAAIALYERLGYVRIAPFDEYWDDPLSIFFEKRL